MTIQFHSVQRGRSPRDAPILLFLHGFMGSVEDWQPVMDQLDEDYCCLALDLPGHGQTECSEEVDYEMEKTGEAIADFLTSQKIETAIPVGYSMGGRISLYCALSFPQLFPQAVIESASPGLRKCEERKLRRELDFERAAWIQADFLNFLEQWYQQPLFTNLKQFSTGFEGMWNRRLRNSPAKLATSLQRVGLGHQPDLWKSLDSHHNPLLLLTGELDQKFTRINQAMMAQCSSAVHEVVSGAGHNIHLEQPEEIAHRIHNSLASQAACSSPPLPLQAP